MIAADSKSNVRTKLNAPLPVDGGMLRNAIQSGARLRMKLNCMLPADRAALFMAIEAERIALEVSRASLCMAAGVSVPHCERLVRVDGRNVSPRFLIAMLRGLRSVKAGTSAGSKKLADLGLARAAFAGCLGAAAIVFKANHDEVSEQLSRAGAFPADAAWRLASQTRSVALYLASCEIGLQGKQLATIARLSPAAVSFALNRIEQMRDDDQFDAALDKAASQVRGK